MVKSSARGSGPSFTQNSLGVLGQGKAAELARVLKPQFHVSIQFQYHMFVLVTCFAPGFPVQMSGHTQMDQQGQALGQPHDNIFTPTGDLLDGAPLDSFAECNRRHFGNGSGPVHPGTGNAAPDDLQSDSGCPPPSVLQATRA